MKNKPKVCILTSGHNASNPRVFHKQAKSLAKAGYDVTFVAPDEADSVIDGVRIKAVPRLKNSLKRMTVTSARVFMAGLAEKAEVYHFHDPELIPYGLILRALGKKVIYDVHEYYRLKLESKGGIPSWLRGFAARAFDLFETIASRFFNGVIVVDQVTGGKFYGRAIQVSNYPYLPEESAQARHAGADGVFWCVYAGGLSGDRGLFKMIEAMEYVDGRVRLVLLGRCREKDWQKAKTLKGYEKVDWLGLLPWPDVMKLLPGCDLGLVLLQPTPAYLYAGENTVKLFEYMMFGLPVLCSDFPNLTRIVEGEGYGLAVDPTSPVRIAEKIMYLMENPELRKKMGERGKDAVDKKYNWETESKKLLGLYDRVLGRAEA